MYSCRRTVCKYSKTLTALMLCCSSLRAWTSCPCPIEMARHSNLSFLARPSMLLVGSDPMERKQMRGVRISDSSQVFSRSRTTPSAYRSPIDSAMYFLACASVRSGHQHLQLEISFTIKPLKLVQKLTAV